MKIPTFALFALLLVLSSCAFAQQMPAIPQEAMEKLREAQELQQKQRFYDALEKLDELDVLVPNMPDVYNMRGSIYLSPSLRDFAKADEMFAKAESLQPDSLPPRFNRAELLFVKHDWAGAAAGFEKLLVDFPKTPMTVRHLVLFKLVVCSIKLGQLEAAEKRLKESFTFMDDTPAYYYANAALSFEKKKESEAKDWLLRANGIFKEGENSAYVDTMMEARWVPNIGLPAIKEDK
jgi:tetratricopeptide (TPR) repeat protein